MYNIICEDVYICPTNTIISIKKMIYDGFENRWPNEHTG